MRKRKKKIECERKDVERIRTGVIEKRDRMGSFGVEG